MPTQTLETRVLGGLTLLLFPASRLGVFAAPAGGAGQFTPISPGVVLQLSGGVAALNGPMFSNCPGQSLPGDNAGSYARSTCSNLSSSTGTGVIRYVHLDTKRGLAIGGGSASGITIAVVGGRAVAMHGGAVPSGATVAIQGFPPLVWGGANVTTRSLNLGNEWRSGLAIMADGRLALAIGVMSIPAFADALIAAGAQYALYTDGGGSTSLVLPDGTRKGAGEGRRVGSWIVVDREPTIGFGQILGGSNAKKYGAALAVAAIIAMAYAASRSEW